MGRGLWLSVLGLAVLAVAQATAHAQPRPYIGYVYPAGGRQGTTVQIRLGGQNLDGVDAVWVSGTGVQAKVTEYFRRLGNQEMTLLREQLTELRRGPKGARPLRSPADRPSGHPCPCRSSCVPTRRSRPDAPPWQPGIRRRRAHLWRRPPPPESLPRDRHPCGAVPTRRRG